jgi:glycosyltransferase involved in cell wall biosynthesis
MRILTTLYYYRPHYSGLTVYTERLARGLAGRGHEVTILTSRYDRRLPPLEQRDGVKVRRLPVAFRLSKGVVLPTMPYWGIRLARSHDVIHLHVPQLDAAPMALAGRMLGRPVVLTYHCDVRLPPSPVNWLAGKASRLADSITARAANAVVANTRDYAEASPFLRRFLSKLVVIPPPVEVATPGPATVETARTRWGIRPGERLIGMAARLATEKGAEVLAHAMPRVLERFPNARVLYVGQYLNVLGEEEYARKLEPLLRSLGDHWTFLGVLPDDEMAAFYSLCDVTALPSLNSTESFGMVQVESMLAGTPVVASDLPGVREPTRRTGMGRTVPPGDANALAEAIVQVLGARGEFHGDPRLLGLYSSASVAEEYERLFERLRAGEPPVQGGRG